MAIPHSSCRPCWQAAGALAFDCSVLMGWKALTWLPCPSYPALVTPSPVTRPWLSCLCYPAPVTLRLLRGLGYPAPVTRPWLPLPRLPGLCYPVTRPWLPCPSYPALVTRPPLPCPSYPAVRYPAVRYPASVTRLPLPGHGYPATVTRPRLPGHGYPATVTRPPLPGHGYPATVTRPPSGLAPCYLAWVLGYAASVTRPLLRGLGSRFSVTRPQLSAHCYPASLTRPRLPGPGHLTHLSVPCFPACSCPNSTCLPSPVQFHIVSFLPSLRLVPQDQCTCRTVSSPPLPDVLARNLRHEPTRLALSRDVDKLNPSDAKGHRASFACSRKSATYSSDATHTVAGGKQQLIITPTCFEADGQCRQQGRSPS